MADKNKIGPNIVEMVEKLGGPKELAKHLDVSASMCRKFALNGIQWWNAHVFLDAGYTPAEIYWANVRAAGKKHKIPKKHIKAGEPENNAN